MSSIDTSGIDVTKPTYGHATTASVRDNFAAILAQLDIARDEITALQALTEGPVMEGTPIQGVAGSGAASALVDISAVTGMRCKIATEGPIKVRFGPLPVTEAIFQLNLLPGTSDTFVVGDTISELSAWGDGGAWKFNIVPVE